MSLHDDCVSKQFVNDVVSIAILATCWHEVPMPPLEGEVPNEREAEGFVRKLSKKTPQSARSGCQLPFQGSQGGFAARVARLATLTSPILLTMCSHICNACNRRGRYLPSCQNATALAAATFRESTPWDMGIFTV